MNDLPSNRLFRTIHLTMLIWLMLFIGKTYASSPTYDYFVSIKQDVANPLNALEGVKKSAQITEVKKAFKLNDVRLTSILKVTSTLPPARFIPLINQLSFVDYAEQIPIYQTFYTPNDLHSNQWNLKKIDAEGAWNHNRDASKIVVAVVDDALLLSHPDLSPNLWVNTGEVVNGVDDDGNGYVDDINGFDVADWDADPNPPSKATSSVFSHGTHCAGIISARTDNNVGIASIGCNAKLMAVKTAQDNTDGRSLQAAYEGVEYAIINHADVISMSWGGGSQSITYQKLFNVAHDAGIVLVAAAGNSNVGSPMFPAGYNHIISVAASNGSDLKASFSNYGSTIDVTAPGVNIWSTVCGSSQYGNMSGTSMACPLVSGLCALMLANSPGIAPDSVEHCLKSTADDIDAANPNYVGKLGAGRINAEQALNCVKGILNPGFDISQSTACPGQEVQFFSDLIGAPGVTFQWSFPGGSPATSTSSSPKVKYVSEGYYGASLKVSNGVRTDELKLDSILLIEIPTAHISGNFDIVSGMTAYPLIEFTGTIPFSISYTDQKTTKSISGITTRRYFLPISPTDTTTYTLTAFNDANCTGPYSGQATVSIRPPDSTCIRDEYSVAFAQPEEIIILDVAIDQAGNIFTCGKIDNGSGTMTAYLMKVDKNGQQQFSRSYSNIPNFEQILIEASSQDLLIEGRGNENITFTRVANDGTLRWSRVYDFAHDRFAYRFVESTNNTYILAGTTYATNLGDDDAFLLKLKGSDGSIVWQRRYHSGDDQMSFVVSNGKGGLFLSGNDAKGHGCMAEFDQDGNFIRYFYANNVAHCRYPSRVDGDLVSLSMIGSGVVALGVSRWDVSGTGPATNKWNLRLNLSSPEFNNQIFCSPYSGNIYISYINNNDKKPNLVLLTKEGKVQEAVISDFSERFKAAFSDTMVVFAGVRQNGGNYEVVIIRRRDRAGMASCIFTKKSFSTSTWTSGVTGGSLTERTISFSNTALNPTTSGVSVEASCLCGAATIESTKSGICLGDSLTLTGTNAARYSWVYADGMNPNDLEKAAIKVSPKSTTTYKLLTFTCECPSDTLRYTVNVENPPGDFLPDERLICKGDTTRLTAPKGFASYDWWDSYRMIAVSDSVVDVYPDKDYRYHARIGSVSGCSSTDSVLIRIDPCCLPEPELEMTSTLVCLGDDVQVTNKSKQDPTATYSWTMPGGVPSSFTGYQPGTIQYPQAGDYTIRLIIESPCGRDTAMIEFSIVQLNIDAGNDTFICPGDSIQIGTSPVTGFQYRWTPAASLNNDSIANPIAKITSATRFHLTVTDDVTGCSESDSFFVDVKPPAEFGLPADTIVCVQDPTIIRAKNPDYVYEWMDGSSGTDYTLKGEDVVWVTGTKGTCSATDSVWLTYQDVPLHEFPSDTTFCRDWSITLTGAVPGYRYLWTPPVLEARALTISDEGLYYVTIINDCGTTTDSVVVTERDCGCYPSVPNAFTPNLDGLNEAFGPSLNCALNLYEFSIYNRWGQCIFQSNSPSDKWDATYKDVPLPVGNYFWILTYKSPDAVLRNTVRMRGVVTVLR